MRQIAQCLNATLTEIYQQSIKLESLSALLADFLPKELVPYCSAGSFKQGCLTLLVTDPVWASQLRYFLPELRNKLRQDAQLYQLTTIKISLNTASMTSSTKKSTRLRQISAHNRQLIHQSSEQCEYLPLKIALQRLAKS